MCPRTKLKILVILVLLILAVTNYLHLQRGTLLQDNVQIRDIMIQIQVERFCQKYNLTKESNYGHRAPEERFLRQILVNQDSKVLYCFAPKVGCTHLKIAFLQSQGLLKNWSPNVYQQTRTDPVFISTVFSTALKALSFKERNKALNDYYKFIMYRNPLERLVSAYRDKVHKYPLKGFKRNTPHYNWIKKEIYQHTHPQEYKQWYAAGGQKEVAISFFDFVTYWLDTGAREDKHFLPIFDLCSPCAIRYDYYGNFKSFNRDAKVLLDKIHGNSSLLLRGYYEGKNGTDTATFQKEVYAQLTKKQKVCVLQKLSQDIDFYYHLFPEEGDSHKRILNISNELGVPHE